MIVKELVAAKLLSLTLPKNQYFHVKKGLLNPFLTLPLDLLLAPSFKSNLKFLQNETLKKIARSNP